jgi:tRNA pseudouridine55 synthase
MVSGWINLYKPSGYSSSYCISLLKKKFKLKKIGHAGTLDPLADGILPVAINEATKTIKFINNKKKTYFFEIKWGEQRDTFDKEGIVINKSNYVPEIKKILLIKKNFVGEVYQNPPIYSAKKINGERAYILARKGIKFKLKKIKKKIYGLKILNHDINNKKTSFLVTCSSGTYVRSLANDLALSLNSFCYCTKITRLRDGIFSKKNSYPLKNLINVENSEDFKKYLLDIRSVLYHIPTIKINDKKLKLIRNGMKVSMLEEVGSKEYKEILADYHQNVVALGSMRNGIFYPKRILNINE